MGFFVGQLMKKTKGQANPQMANEIFRNSRIIEEKRDSVYEPCEFAAETIHADPVIIGILWTSR